MGHGEAVHAAVALVPRSLGGVGDLDDDLGVRSAVQLDHGAEPLGGRLHVFGEGAAGGPEFAADQLGLVVAVALHHGGRLAHGLEVCQAVAGHDLGGGHLAGHDPVHPGLGVAGHGRPGLEGLTGRVVLRRAQQRPEDEHGQGHHHQGADGDPPAALPPGPGRRGGIRLAGRQVGDVAIAGAGDIGRLRGLRRLRGPCWVGGFGDVRG
ncbi:hypothetical protein ACFFX0_12570 [Citricoccus parietis]|uniref:Uncharacterized protein n=1 Tax=Citricoccus parietis TaxID=592307 RepID=A0ABV5FZB6_9MICC